MKRYGFRWIWIVTVGLSMAVLLSVNGFAFGPGHGHRDVGFGGLKMLMNLDLSVDQKSQIKTILDQNQEEQDRLRDQVRIARDVFQDAVEHEPLNDQQIREAFRAMSPAMEEMAVFHTRLRTELMEVLTADQLQGLEARRAEKRNRHEDHRGYRKAILNAWLSSDTD